MATRKNKIFNWGLHYGLLLLNEDHLKWYAFKILCILLNFTEIWFYIVDDSVLDSMPASFMDLNFILQSIKKIVIIGIYLYLCLYLSISQINHNK